MCRKSITCARTRSMGFLLALLLILAAPVQAPAGAAGTGATLASASISQLMPQQTNQWILIPDWLAGTWRARSELILSSFDYEHGRSVIDSPVKLSISRVSVLGAQKDSRGGMWHYIGVPFTRSIKTDSFSEYQKVEQISLLESSSDKLTVSTMAMVTRIDKGGRETLEVFREETATTYTPLKDGLIQVTFSTKDFDLQGRPTFASIETCLEKRISGFHEIDQDENGNLRELFRQFLSDNGMGNLWQN